MEDNKAMKAAAKKLEQQTGLYVGGAYGFADSNFNGEPEWYLIVWSDEEVEVPETFEGFRVVRRGIPVAQ